MNAPRYYILGSCVSRDAFSDGRAPEVADYVARTSLGSAFARKPQAAPPTFERLPSAFQRRMAEMDWHKTLPAKLTETAFDFLLVDLIDERFDVAEIGGSLVSVSNEFQNTGYPLDGLTRHPFGSPEHTEAFRIAFNGLINLVDPERIVVSRAYWARMLSDGRPTADSGYVDGANQNLERLYSIVKSAGVHWIEFSPEQLRGALDHKWGVSPFHYVDSFYGQVQASLAEIAATS